MTKEDIYNYTKKMYRILDNPKFIIKFFRSSDFQGECYQGQNLIRLNPHQYLIPTIIHELLHEIDHEMPEEQVAAKEREIMSQLSHRQLINILEKTTKALRRSSTWKKKISSNSMKRK